MVSFTEVCRPVAAAKFTVIAALGLPSSQRRHTVYRIPYRTGAVSVFCASVALHRERTATRERCGDGVTVVKRVGHT
eukprot:6182984-Pleurochrysis_carterae.AAC.1